MDLLSVDEALQRLLSRALPLPDIEDVATLNAAGRVLATEQHSAMHVPPMDNSAMDGYALRVADVPAPGTQLSLDQRIAAGSVGQPLVAGTAARIFTGAPIPPGADAVVMQEQCVVDGDAVRINARPASGEWIRRTGSDIRQGEVILDAGRRLRPQDCGLAASVGLARLPVVRRVRLGLFFTGDELVMPGDPLPPGRIYNSNRFTLNGLAQAFDCEVHDYGIVPDSLDATRSALRCAAAQCDLIVTSGGVSVGEADFVKRAVEAEGELLLWRIAMKPGRPLAFGRVRSPDDTHGPVKGTNGASFIGLPGNPVASFVTFLWFVRPFLMRLQGVADVAVRGVQARADFDWTAPDTRREFLRARWNAAGGLEIYPTQDSAALSSTVWADGLIDNPPGTAIGRGDSVRFVAFKDMLP